MNEREQIERAIEGLELALEMLVHQLDIMDMADEMNAQAEEE